MEEGFEVYKPHKDFTTLNAWKKCQDVKLFFYEQILTQLPIEEKYDLGSQMRRAAISITANIAEGYGRFHFQKAFNFIEYQEARYLNLKTI